MKTLKYNPDPIKIIQVIIILFVLQINFLTAANSIGTRHVNTCVTCANSATATQKEELFNELILLAPSAPTEATFSEDAAVSEIIIVPVTPTEAFFDEDDEFNSTYIPEYLVPTTIPEADFND